MDEDRPTPDGTEGPTDETEPVPEAGESLGSPTEPPVLPPAETTVPLTERFPRSIKILLLFMVLLVLLFIILLTEYNRYRISSAVSGVKREMRSMAVAIESYYVDNMSYPACTLQRSLMDCVGGFPEGAPLSYTFLRYTGSGGSFSLTTPVSYLTTCYYDPFAQPYRMPYRYYSLPFGWILASYGPDADYMEGGDLGFDDGTVTRVYDPRNRAEPSPELLTGAGIRGSYTYDPSNGLVSNGDLWRVKQ